jgi:hypothetical protein
MGTMIQNRLGGASLALAQLAEPGYHGQGRLSFTTDMPKRPRLRSGPRWSRRPSFLTRTAFFGSETKAA